MNKKVLGQHNDSMKVIGSLENSAVLRNDHNSPLVESMLAGRSEGGGRGGIASRRRMLEKNLGRPCLGQLGQTEELVGVIGSATMPLQHSKPSGLV